MSLVTRSSTAVARVSLNIVSCLLKVIPVKYSFCSACFDEQLLSCNNFKFVNLCFIATSGSTGNPEYFVICEVPI